MKYSLGILCTAAALALSSTAAHATLVVENITYNLSQSFLSATQDAETWSLTLDILNQSNDGRTGVTSMAFNRPSNFISASLPGWTTLAGGLNGSGCNGTGNFFCFSGYAAAAPTMSFTFSVTAAAGSNAFAAYNPSFKIDWIGSKNNYDLVSQPIGTTTQVPEPGTIALLGLGLMGMVLTLRRKTA